MERGCGCVENEQTASKKDVLRPIKLIGVFLSWREFIYFFFVQFLSYGFLCWNYRAVAQARMGHIVASDVCCAAVSFSLIRHVANAKSRWAGVGYVAGGVAGSVVSVWLTRDLFGR